jgi:hypothetical protein
MRGVAPAPPFDRSSPLKTPTIPSRQMLRRRPILAQLHKFIQRRLKVVDLRVQELPQLSNGIIFRLFDIHHAAHDVFTGLFVFDLLGADFVFAAEVVFPRFGVLAERGVVGETAGVEFSACGLRQCD